MSGVTAFRDRFLRQGSWSTENDGDPYQMVFVVRNKLDDGTIPSEDDAMSACVSAMFSLFDGYGTDADLTNRVNEWIKSRIRKIVKRAHGSKWRKLESAVESGDVAIPSSVTLNAHGEGVVYAFAPMRASEMPKVLRNLQVSGLDLWRSQCDGLNHQESGSERTLLVTLNDDVEMIRKYYGAKGYADANVRPVIDEVGVDENGMRLVDIRYDINEGSRSNVGRIQVRGNTTTKTNVILRELPLHPGDNMSSVDLDIAQKRLENLGYFIPQSVSVTQSSSNMPGFRDINIDVQEAQTGQLTLGVAFSSVENVYLYATVVQTNFDIRGFTNGVFTGGGQRLTLSAKIGTEYKSASIYLLEPWFLERKLALGNEIYYSDSTYMSDFYEQTSFGYGISLQKALDEFQSVKLEYRIERYKIDPEGYCPPFFRENSGDFNRSHLRLSYKYDSRDAEITPRKGGSLEAYVGYSGPGSTVETYTAGVSGSYYYNTFWDTIFSVNFGAEAIRAVDDNETVPLFERCYLGGPNNLRGFRYRDVGMVNSALAGDETMGGLNSAFVQLEATVPLIESMRFAVFFDAGLVNDSLHDINTDGISADVGFGLRLNLPMGPIAIDYAIPVRTGNAIDDGGQFQFYVNYKY